MSKKMMKRSLALGALMAFVITGQAWAADCGLNLSGNVELDNISVVCGSDCKHYGVSVQSGTNLTVNGEVNIEVTDSVYDSRTIAYHQANANACFNTIKGNATIIAKNTNSNNVRAVNVQSDKENKLIFAGAETYIEANAKGGEAIAVYSSGTNDTGVSFKGEKVDISVNGTGVYGIFARNAASVLADKNTAVKITATGSTGWDACGIYNEVGSGDVGKYNGGKVKLLGDVEITATSEGSALPFAILNYNNAGVNANANALPETIIGSEGSKVVINGNVAAHSGTIEINFGTNDSKLTGAVGTDYDANTLGEGAVTLNFAEGATWNVTGNSEVATLAGDGGIIEVNDLKTKVTVAEDKATNLTVQQAGVTADNLATAEAQEAQLEALAKAVTNEDDISVADTVAIAEGEVVGAVTASVEDGVVDKAVEAVNTTNQAIGEAAVAVKAHYRAHMNDMNKRMGELRNANGEHGVWTRIVRGESEYEGMKAQYNQYQLGYDEKLSTDKRWTVGAAVTFAEGEGSFGKGSTEDDSTAFAIYGSKLNNDGTFVDLIARYAHMESDVTVGADKGDYDVNGYSVSAEFGKRIQQGKGFWIEPQVELTYGTVDSAEYVIGGKTVQVGDMDSIIGRVGFSLGKDIKQGNVYARASYLYDFDGETESAFSNAAGVTRTIEEDLGGGWWEVGVGANINLSKATYVYADIEKTFGGEVDTNWQWNLGVRYSF